MADEIEEIEARLAAYIDGTLPDAHKAEIEAYLAANPTHGKLIAELQSIRAAVRSLPREPAPAEVLDTLQSQLERQSLLEPVHEPVPPRADRWPQLGAVAAVLLLAGGLALLIYQVMPGPRRGDSDLALLTAPTGQDKASRDTVDLNDVGPPAASPPAKTRDATAATGPSAGSGVSRGFSSSSQEPGQAAMQQQSQRLRQPAGQDADAASDGRGPAGPTTSHDPSTAQLYYAATRPAGVAPSIVIRSDDPLLTRNLLAASLTRDRYAFEVPSVVPGVAVGTIIGRLREAGQLSAGEADAALAYQNVLVRRMTRDAAVALVEDVNRQRPGRQTAGLTGYADTPPAAATPPADAATRPAPATQATRPAETPADALAALVNARREQTAATAPADDVVVLIVPSTPATTRAATQPATLPLP